MDFRALPPQRPLDIGRGHAGPHTRFGKRRNDRFVISCHFVAIVESVSNDGWRLFWQLSENRLHYARITTTGILQWVSTFTVSLPSTIAEMPRRPWDAIKIASHPVFLAVSIMAS